MNKIKLLTILSIGLLILNLVLIGFILAHAPSKRGRGDARQELIIRKLNFSDMQAQAFKELAYQHHEETMRVRDRMNELRNALYATLNKNDASKDSIITAISNAQMNIENIQYKHFEDIKAMCTPEQLPAYEKLTKELTIIFSQRKPINEHR